MIVREKHILKTLLFFNLLMLGQCAFADFCKDTETVCIQPGGTRDFDGVPVTLPCWEYRVTKYCGAATDDNCKPLRAQGCEQTNATCRIKISNVCLVQDETYSCPVKTCKDTDGIVCGSSFFCMNGDCSEHIPVKNKNFGKDISEFAAIGQAAAEVRDQNTMSPHIFTGKVMQCSVDMLGSKNCCKDSGWAKGWFLNCDDEERELGLAKEKGLVVKAGDGTNNTYCHNRHLGVCTAKHQVYCVFPNKLSLIVQSQGRPQIGKDFGHIGDDRDDVHPDCGGFTIDELQSLNFDAMDFTAMYDEIRAKVHLPDESKIDDYIKQKIKDFYDKKKKHS